MNKIIYFKIFQKLHFHMSSFCTLGLSCQAIWPILCPMCPIQCKALVKLTPWIHSQKDMLNCDEMAFPRRISQFVLTVVLLLIIVTLYDVSAPPEQGAQGINRDLPQLYKERQSHIENICEKYHDRLEKDYKRFQPRLSYHNVISKVDLFRSRTKKPFLWCRVPKASSQSWNDLFMSIW